MINDIKETINSIKASLYDRTSDPFAGKVILYFFIFNWQFFYMLVFGEGDGGYRLAFVKDQFGFPWAESDFESCSSFFHGPGRIYGIPILLAGAHFFIYPFIKRFFVTFSEKRKAEIENSKKETSNQHLLTREQGIQLRDRLEFLNNQLQDQKVNDYDIAGFRHLTTLGYAGLHNSREHDYRIIKMSELDVARLSIPGLWIIINIQSLTGKFYDSSVGRELADQEFPAIFLESLNQEYVIVQFKGSIDLNGRTDLDKLKYEWGKEYKFSPSNAGYLEELKDPNGGEAAFRTCKITDGGTIMIASNAKKASIGTNRVRVFTVS